MVVGPNSVRPAAANWVIGLDIGQRRDYSAIAILEWIQESDKTRDPVTFDFKRRLSVRLRHAERVRLGTPFAGVVDRISQILSDPRLNGCTLVVDATGVGAPVVEMLRAANLPCRLIPAQITGGMDEGSDGTYFRVPKRDLVVGLQILIQQGPFEIMKSSPGVEALMKELVAFRARRSGNGHTRYEGPKDDLTMSLALAWWWMRKQVAWQ